jgi:hypothetical protein
MLVALVSLGVPKNKRFRAHSKENRSEDRLAKRRSRHRSPVGIP